MAKITYEDKEQINTYPDIPRKNKTTADDLNEIKQTINANDDNVGDLTQLNTTNKDSVVNAINEVNEIAIKKVATAQLKTSINTSISTPQTIQMDNIISTTSLLTLENGGIKIGAGISKVLISANIFCIKDTSDFYMWYSIQKNGTNVALSITPAIVNFGAVVISPKIIEVEEGDILTVWKEDSYACKIRGANKNTWLTVEVIE